MSVLTYFVGLYECVTYLVGSYECVIYLVGSYDCVTYLVGSYECVTYLVGSYECNDLLGWVVGACRPMSGVGSEQTTPHAHVCPLHVVHTFKCPLAPQLLNGLYDQRICPANIHQTGSLLHNSTRS